MTVLTSGFAKIQLDVKTTEKKKRKEKNQGPKYFFHAKYPTPKSIKFPFTTPES